ncbi:MAG: hypothetical protein ACOCXT_05395 [Candidatus Dojkabacteria bacterium]
MMSRLRLNPSWNIIFENNQLILTAGGDEMYLVDELDESHAKKFYEAVKSGNSKVLTENKQLNSFTDKLRASGIILDNSTVQPSTGVSYNITWYGNQVEEIEKHLEKLLDPVRINRTATPKKESHVHILIRSNATLREVLETYKNEGTQLYIDLAYRNHISIGPFVSRGETACASCFIGRVNRNWGDPQPPVEPEAQKDITFIASLIAKYLDEYRRDGTINRLIGHAMQMNTASFETQYDRVLRLPWCPHCFPDHEYTYGTGSFELPWLNS